MSGLFAVFLFWSVKCCLCLSSLPFAAFLLPWWFPLSFFSVASILAFFVFVVKIVFIVLSCL